MIALCRKSYREDVQIAVGGIIADKTRLKERAELVDALGKQDKRFPCRTEAWWDIENDWLAWLDVKRTPLVLRAFGAFAEKQKK